VNAKPFLVEIGEALRAAALDAVLIGNAAALQGAPVTTIDFDFLFGKTRRNITSIRAVADALGAAILRPYSRAADMYRLVRDDGLQIDFMAAIHAVRSFEGLRARADRIDLGSTSITVAALADIIKSKKAARRPRDMAVLEVLEKALEEKEQKGTTRRRPPRE
jgi:hypothetical protein